MARAVVALGSNLGPRAALLERAHVAIGRLPGTRVVARSRARETPPERPDDGGPFLNAAALVETRLSPVELVRGLLALERRLGRRRDGRRGPRPIDLDLVLYEGARRVAGPALVPHPRFRSRRFVLDPAAEVAPALRDPQTGLRLDALRAAACRPGPGAGA